MPLAPEPLLLFTSSTNHNHQAILQQSIQHHGCPYCYLSPTCSLMPSKFNNLCLRSSHITTPEQTDFEWLINAIWFRLTAHPQSFNMKRLEHAEEAQSMEVLPLNLRPRHGMFSFYPLLSSMFCSSFLYCLGRSEKLHFRLISKSYVVLPSIIRRLAGYSCFLL